ERSAVFLQLARPHFHFPHFPLRPFFRPVLVLLAHLQQLRHQLQHFSHVFGLCAVPSPLITVKHTTEAFRTSWPRISPGHDVFGVFQHRSPAQICRNLISEEWTHPHQR